MSDVELACGAVCALLSGIVWFNRRYDLLHQCSFGTSDLTSWKRRSASLCPEFAPGDPVGV
jgi:hypothetical protein